MDCPLSTKHVEIEGLTLDGQRCVHVGLFGAIRDGHL